MTTHPPGQPSGPTGPGRDPGLLPTVGMVVRDGERIGAQLLAILNRQLDPASLPPEGPAFHRVDFLLESAGYHIEAALRDLAEIAALPLPPVGSAIKLPAVAPVAAGESPGGLPAPGAPSTGRIEVQFVGGLETTEGQAAFAKAVTDAMTRQQRRTRSR